jgi:hypothetical protein
MNLNAIIAVLELKGILSRDEGEKLVEHLNNKPQSTMLADMVTQVKDFVTKVEPKHLLEQLTPAVEKIAKAEASKVLEPIKADTEKIAKAVEADADAAGKTAADTVKKVTDSTPKK